MGKALESVYAESLPEEECGVVERSKERRGGTAMAEIPDKSHNAEFYSSNWMWEKKRKRERKTREADTRACNQGFEMGEEYRLLHFRFCITRVNDTMRA
jgi:hypothetical protein